MSKASEAGKVFMAGVVAKVPEERRAQAEAAAAVIMESEEALVVLGSGALAQADINRKYAELDTLKEDLDAKIAESLETHTKQTSWWDTNQTKLKEFDTVKAERDRLKAGGGTNVPDPNAPSADDLRKEFNDRITSLQTEGVGVMAFMADLAVRHYAEFQERPDMTALLNDKNLGKPMGDGRTYSLVNAYETKYGEQIKARNQKSEDDRINKLADERVKERMKGMSQPFPLRDAPSVLDVLENTADKPENHTVDSAASLYETLQAARA